jgi:hypothetical protein
MTIRPLTKLLQPLQRTFWKGAHDGRMTLTGKHKVVAAAVVALAGAQALAIPVASAASGAPGPPPMAQLAVLPERAGLRKRRRYGVVRAIRSGLVFRRSGCGASSHPRRPNVLPRPPVRDSLARGPPFAAIELHARDGAAIGRPVVRPQPARRRSTRERPEQAGPAHRPRNGRALRRTTADSCRPRKRHHLGTAKCAQGDSNSHGPNGPQGSQPCAIPACPFLLPSKRPFHPGRRTIWT